MNVHNCSRLGNKFRHLLLRWENSVSFRYYYFCLSFYILFHFWFLSRHDQRATTSTTRSPISNCSESRFLPRPLFPVRFYWSVWSRYLSQASRPLSNLDRSLFPAEHCSTNVVLDMDIFWKQKTVFSFYYIFVHRIAISSFLSRIICTDNKHSFLT